MFLALDCDSIQSQYVEFFFFEAFLEHVCDKTLSHVGDLANKTLYGSKLSIFLLCQKSLGY